MAKPPNPATVPSIPEFQWASQNDVAGPGPTAWSARPHHAL